MTNTKGLTNFLNKLQVRKELAKSGELENRIADVIADSCEDIANAKYHRVQAQIYASKVEAINGISNVFAIDMKERPTIAYLEYGVGFYAKGSYEGDLPTQTLTFESAGKTRSTNGWEYYYDNPDTKVEYKNVKGWFFQLGNSGEKHFSSGWTARAYMWDTSKEIKGELSDIIEKKVDEIFK